MLDFLFWISAKKIVVAFAFLGAFFVTIAPEASKFAERRLNTRSDQEVSLLAQALEKFFVRVGYAFAGLSITLFIVAGFIVDLK